jgi:hypothetical protein
VQHSQQNYKQLQLGALFVLLAALPGGGLEAAPSERLLTDGTPGPCDARLDQPDYVGGVDVAGNPVAPADLPAARNPVPDGVLVPLKRGSRHAGQAPVVTLDGKALDTLLNAKPACPPKTR